MNNNQGWTGKIPENWKVTRLKYVLEEMASGGTPDTSNEENWSENGVNWVAIGDMSSVDFVSSTTKSVSVHGLQEKRLKVFRSGTLLFSMYASLGHVAELGVPAAINQAILALVPKASYDKSFLKRWLQHTQPFLGEFASSNTQDNLNAEKVKNLTIVIPSLSEQRSIACYLDRTISKVDQIIRKRQVLIELLQEKRQSLIT